LHDFLFKIRDAFFQPTWNCSCNWCGVESALEMDCICNCKIGDGNICDVNACSNSNKQKMSVNCDLFESKEFREYMAKKLFNYQIFSLLNEEKIREGLQKNFNEQALAFLESFFQGSLYKSIHMGIKNFITTIFEPNTFITQETSKRLSTLDFYYPHVHSKETQWNYICDDQKQIIGIQGTLCKQVLDACQLGEKETLDIILKLEYVYYFTCTGPTLFGLIPFHLYGTIMLTRHYNKTNNEVSSNEKMNATYNFAGKTDVFIIDSIAEKESLQKRLPQLPLIKPYKMDKDSKTYKVDENSKTFGVNDLDFKSLDITGEFFYSYGFNTSNILPI
jgi:hypothetical protein